MKFKSERERQIPYDITCMWTLKQDTNEFIYKTETDSQTQRTKEKGSEGERNQEFGISRYKLLYIKYIGNKVQLYRTGNYIQYSIIKHNGKEYEKEYIYIYESLRHTPEINTTL